MAHLSRSRLPVVVAAAAAAATLAGSSPAFASDPGVLGAPGPDALQLPNIAPLPSFGSKAHPSIRRARIVPRRLHRGKRARLKLTLSTPARVRILIERRVRGRLVRKRSITVVARKTKVSIRLPKGVHGHAFAPGRFRITVVAIDGAGMRSLPLRRNLRVIKKAR
jgi:hypothetical protein